MSLNKKKTKKNKQKGGSIWTLYNMFAIISGCVVLFMLYKYLSSKEDTPEYQVNRESSVNLDNQVNTNQDKTYHPFINDIHWLKNQQSAYSQRLEGEEIFLDEYDDMVSEKIDPLNGTNSTVGYPFNNQPSNIPQFIPVNKYY